MSRVSGFGFCVSGFGFCIVGARVSIKSFGFTGRGGAERSIPATRAPAPDLAFEMEDWEKFRESCFLIQVLRFRDEV